MPTFLPPTVADQPALTDTFPADIRAEDKALARKLFRHGKAKYRGRSVLRIAGVYVTVDTPTTDQLASATEVYQGGHEYPVDQATADRLTAAGYTVGA